jgi:hypothetical protein
MDAGWFVAGKTISRTAAPPPTHSESPKTQLTPPTQINATDSVSCWLTAAPASPVSWFHRFKVVLGSSQGPWESEHHNVPKGEGQYESSDPLHCPHSLGLLTELESSSVTLEWLPFLFCDMRLNTSGNSANILVNCFKKLDSKVNLWSPPFMGGSKSYC